jgi:predicted RNA binding protein YcfA (HicA-like mRNA interferase family)
MAGIIPVGKHGTKEVPQGTANKILKQAGLK